MSDDGRGNGTRGKGIWALVVLSVLSLVAGCSGSDATARALPTPMPLPTASLEPRATPDSGNNDPTPVCPPTRGEGTIPPAVSIYSITFVVNGLDQVVRAGDTLQASPGDEMEVREMTICAGAFSGNSGEVCVDFAPIDQNGQEIISEHEGTHMVRMIPGFMTITGPTHTWTIGGNWRQIFAVLNHWPPEETEDLDCGSRRCEHDDRILFRLR